MQFPANNTVHSIKRWLTALLSAVSVGLACGLVGTLFHYAVDMAAELRAEHPWILFLLPLGGLAIIKLYRLGRVPLSIGTDAVLEAACQRKDVPLMLSPLIFAATVITHLLGGSAGREGAALQLGGTVALGVGRVAPAFQKERSTLILSGMGAMFAALFGTPLAAAFFVLEVGKVGVFRYPSLLPCVVSSVTAYLLAQALGVPSALISLASALPLSLPVAASVLLLSPAFALTAMLFVHIMHRAHHVAERLFSNSYLRAAAGGCTVVALTLLLGTQAYNGAGMAVILRALHGEAAPYAFLIKICLTALTLSAGFKGGEIVPAFFVGATLGCAIGNLVGFAPDVAAAMGLVGVFAGATKAPMAAVLLGAEMFGVRYLPLFGLSAAVSFALSGKDSLYHSQGFAEIEP